MVFRMEAYVVRLASDCDTVSECYVWVHATRYECRLMRFDNFRMSVFKMMLAFQS